MRSRNLISPARRRRVVGGVAILVACLLLVLGFRWATVRPSHERAWVVPQAILPEVEFEGELVRIRNVRDFAWRSEADFTPRYRDETYHLSEVERVWFVLSPFNPEWRGAAHSFVTFDFIDGRHLSISVEARREAGEEYSVVKGLLRNYELIYVIGTERDLIGLRSVVWDDPTYLYPTIATPAKARALLEVLLRRAAEIGQQPAFYNTATRSCNSELRDAANLIADRRIPYGIGVIVPGYADELALDHGLIATDLEIAQARERYQINERAKAAFGSEDFSELIRTF